MVGSMVIFLWVGVAQADIVAILGVVVFSWVVGIVSRRGKSYKVKLGESSLVGCVSVRSIVGAMEVLR